MILVIFDGHISLVFYFFLNHADFYMELPTSGYKWRKKRMGPLWKIGERV